MPQLPSGRRIGLSADSVFERVLAADPDTLNEIRSTVHDPRDLLPLIDLVEFIPTVGAKEPSVPSATGLVAADMVASAATGRPRTRTPYAIGSVPLQQRNGWKTASTSSKPRSRIRKTEGARGAPAMLHARHRQSRRVIHPIAPTKKPAGGVPCGAFFGVAKCWRPSRA